jgi:O-antigen chain-terminating methyltransferase
MREWAQAQLDAVRREQAQVLGEAARHAESVRLVRERTSRAEKKLRRILHLLSSDDGREQLERLEVKAKAAPLDLEPAFDYFGFEERFRGNEEDIQQRQRLYLEYFKGARDVLDIGCGRGEFLALLKSAGIEATGVDADLDMVLLCREKGLAVVEADAFAYLESLPDASVGGIFSAQMIEHLDAGQIIRLVQLSHRKLRPDGVLILETPNPRCLTVFAESFYMDLSHIRLIHPETARFLLECMGFGNVELKFSAPVERSARVPPFPADGLPEAALADFNRGIERLNELLYGYQDYAVIGAKIDASI